VLEVASFKRIFTVILGEEIIIRKTRRLYLFKNARIHLDTVENLGCFLEIEVVGGDPTLTKDYELMEFLQQKLKLRDADARSLGYRELMLHKSLPKRDLEYYFFSEKVYWVLNASIPKYNLDANQLVPCIFMEGAIDNPRILQFPLSIRDDKYRYTAWRSLLGKIGCVRVIVGLIVNIEDDGNAEEQLLLISLENRRKIEWDTVRHSDIELPRSCLSPLGLKCT